MSYVVFFIFYFVCTKVILIFFRTLAFIYTYYKYILYSYFKLDKLDSE